MIVTCDLGFRIHHQITCRLGGINAPELRTAEGKDARDALMLMISGKTLVIRTIKDKTEKYGRMLVVILMDDGVTTVNDWLVEHGYAVPYMV